MSSFISSIGVLLTSPTATPGPLYSTSESASTQIEEKGTSGTITAAVVLVTLVFVFGYCAGGYYLYRFTQRNPKVINKANGIKVQKYTPFVYASLILINLLEIAIGSWLLAQYAHIGLYPNVGARDGVRLILFSASWTLLTATVLLVFFLHPTLSTHFICSIGSQALWILVTWCFWVACIATLNRALPLMTLHAQCAGSMYCGQLQAVFAFAVIELLAFILGILVSAWLIWQNMRSGSGSILPW